MIRLYIVSIILFVFTTTFLNAEVVSKIEINGNKRVGDETIKVYGEIKPLNSNFTQNDLDSILKNLYSTNFFEDINIKISNSALIIDLVEYPLINEIIIIGEPKKGTRKQIKELISLKEKSSFIKNNLNNDVNLIKELYSSLGFKFAVINSKVREIDKNNYDIAIEIDRGELTKIKKIFFTGNKKIKEKRLRDIIASDEDIFWKIISKNSRFSESQVNLDKRLLLNYYKNLGYYDVKITSTSAEVINSQKVNLYYSIEAGDRFLLEKIETVVDPTFDKKIFYPLKKSYKKVVGDYYSPAKVKKILEEIDDLIDKNNLQFVEHDVSENIDGNKIGLKFNIREGKKIVVERINIKGNNVTNESVIRAELLLDEGDPFTNLSLEKSIAKLKSKDIFKSVQSEILQGSSVDLKLINISVEEKPTGEISAGAGVGTNGGSFAFNIKENNYLGNGKIIGLDFEINKESIKGQFSYIDPNYDLLGNSVRYTLANTTNDKPDQGYENSILSVGASTAFEQYNDVFTNIGFDLSYDDLKTTSAASTSLKKQEGNFLELAASYGFSYDKRDRSFMPTDGFITKFNQSIPIYADKPFIDNNLSTSIYHLFSEDIIASGKLSLSAINGLNDEDVRVSKRKFLSSRRLRGFEQGKVGPMDSKDHIGGNYAAALNFDASLPNLLPESTNTDVSLFLDFGNVWGVDYNKDLDSSNKIRSATGVNASWMSPLGPMTFTFATNLSKAKTDKTESFNFNLGTSF
jgi:outer membrane protein insertion porin family